MKEAPEKSLEEVVREDGRYPLEAFAFLNKALGRAVKDIHGSAGEEGPHHVTGQQLCRALREEARDRWGMLAPAVLERWNIHGSIDFGRMVYLLVENRIMSKTEEDSIEDFRDVFDFDQAFSADQVFESN
jgi:uncharacterized repeat protein (TIGR04138 family)